MLNDAKELDYLSETTRRQVDQMLLDRFAIEAPIEFLLSQAAEAEGVSVYSYTYAEMAAVAYEWASVMMSARKDCHDQAD